MTVPTRTEKCACGDRITITDPTVQRVESAMRRHVHSPMHQAWRGFRYHACAGVGGSTCIVTIPNDRTHCHYCRRTMELAGMSVAA